MALIIKKKKSAENVLDNEQQENITLKPIPIVLQNDYDGINNDKINGIKENLKKEFIKLENQLELIVEKNWKYNSKFVYDFIINLEMLSKNVSEIFILENKREFESTEISSYYSKIVKEIFENNVSKNLKYFFNKDKTHFFLKEFRNILIHSPNIEFIFENFREKFLEKDKNLIFIKMLDNVKDKNEILLEQILKHIQNFSKLTKNSTPDIFISIFELKESIFYQHILDKMDGKRSDLTVDKLDSKTFPGNINTFHFINSLRNELFNDIIKKTNKSSLNFDDKIDFKIKAFFTKIDLDKIKDFLYSYLINLCELELKRNNNISNNFIGKVLETNFINPFYLSKEDQAIFKKLPSKLEHNIIELNIKKLTLASEKIEDKTMESYKEVKKIMKDIKEEQISDSYYSFYRSIINRIEYFEQQNGINQGLSS